MAKQSICRPVVFYNNYVPPVKEVQKWKYCVFGMLDGIDIEDNIAEKDEQILRSIWRHQQAFCKKLKGKYMAQVIYAIKYDEIEKEQAFWDSDDTKYLFNFFVRVQFKGDINALLNKRELLQEFLCQENRVLANVYMTYDNSDFLIVLKTVSYEEGENIINMLRNGEEIANALNVCCRLKNSFSALAVKQSIINIAESLRFNDIVAQADVRIIEKHCGGAEKIEEFLKRNSKGVLNDKNCIRTQVLGTDDEIISFFGIEWKTLLSMYKDADGVFSSSSEQYKQNILGTTSVIVTRAGAKSSKRERTFEQIKEGGGTDAEEELIAYAEKINESSEDNGREEQYGEYIKKIYGRLDKIRVLDRGAMYKSLDVIVNALAKFEEPVFSDYIFITMIRPLDCLLDMIVKNAERNSPWALLYNRKLYFNFVRSFNLYAQNSIRSDRHSMQIMDINARIYDIPVKLNAFYNAYIYRICGLLNKKDKEDTSIEYNFFAIPGIEDKVSVLEMYKMVYPERRLIKVEIPEKNYYDMRRMMIVLGHEVAHYVGRAVRKREYRYENFIKNFAHIYVSYVICLYIQYNKEQGKKSLDICSFEECLEERMENMLKHALDRETNQDYINNCKIDKRYMGDKADAKKIAEKNKDYKTYIYFIKKCLGTAMNDISMYCLEDIFSPVIYGINKDEADNFLRIIQQITERYMYIYPEESTVLSMNTAVKGLINVYEECFADLMSILLLELKPYDYFNSLVEEAMGQGTSEEDLIGSNYEYVFRALFVMLCMIKKQENMYFWDLKDIKKIVCNGNCSKALAALVKQIAIIYEKYFNRNKALYKSGEDYDKNCSNIFKDKKIIANILEYLLQCKSKYFEIAGKPENKARDTKNINTIRSLYNHCKCDSVNLESQIVEQMEFVAEYKQDLFDHNDMEENI